MVKCKTRKQKEILENLSKSINALNLLFLVFVFVRILWFDMAVSGWQFIIAFLLLFITFILVCISLAKSDESDDDEANKIQIASNSMMLFVYVFVVVLYSLNIKAQREMKLQNKKISKYEITVLVYAVIAILINFISIFLMSYSIA